MEEETPSLSLSFPGANWTMSAGFIRLPYILLGGARSCMCVCLCVYVENEETPCQCRHSIDIALKLEHMPFEEMHSRGGLSE